MTRPANLVVLGSGTSEPHSRRGASAFYLDTSAGKVLLDAGADAGHRLAIENLQWAELDAIWISHFHLDHVGGLAPLLFGTKYAFATQARRKPLVITGPRGLRKVIERFDAAYDYGLLAQPFPVEVREVDPDGEFELLPGVQATTHSTPHTPESLALRLALPLADGARTFVYTADTGRDEGLADFARDADMLIIEASFRHRSPVATHLTLPDALAIVEASGARRAMLTHFYSEWDEFDIETEARSEAPELVVLEAQDGRRGEID